MRLVTLHESIKHQKILDVVASNIDAELANEWIPKLVEFCRKYGPNVSIKKDATTEEIQRYIEFRSLTDRGTIGDHVSKHDLQELWPTLSTVKIKVVFIPIAEHEPDSGYDAGVYYREINTIQINAVERYIKYDENYHSVLVHELRHAYEYLCTTNKLRRDPGRGTEYVDPLSTSVQDVDNRYLYSQIEISARTAQAMRDVMLYITNNDIGSMPNKELEQLVLKAMYTHNLVDMFTSKKTQMGDPNFDYISTEDVDTTAVPSDNKYYRKIFNKIFAYAQEKMKETHETNLRWEKSNKK